MNTTHLTLYTYRAICTNVVDGDTVDLVIDMGFRNTSERRIRLSGIDTPERGQEGFQEAKDFLNDLLLGKECYLRSYKSGAFGRWLGEIFIDAAGAETEVQNVNQLMLDKGFAEIYS